LFLEVWPLRQARTAPLLAHEVRLCLVGDTVACSQVGRRWVVYRL
jgi:hypothetical protein